MNSISKLMVGAVWAVGALCTACSDWTDTEAFTVNETNIQEQNPDLYARYLANLREYRTTSHKWVYAWFDNSEKKPYSRAHHLTDIPDSIDVVSLMYPDKLVKSEMQEINQIRDEKGMKVIYDVDFDQLKTIYNNMVNEAPENEPVAIEFRQFLTDTLAYSLSLANKYQYDGICIKYKGRLPIYMTEEEKKEYKENENNFINMVNDWKERNPEKMLLFLGNPENLYEGVFILDKCNTIFVSGETATSGSELSYILAQSYLLEYGQKYGAVADVKNTNLTMQAFGQWAVQQHFENQLDAVGVYNVASDYYSSGYNYKNVREMISILNPSVK